MDEKSFISVILPLKLDWEPCYHTYESVCIGDRVKVAFAGRTYIGVVSGTSIEPDIAPERIKPVIAVENGMARIRKEEIELWRQVARYYLCTTGEVYKAAYPLVKISMEKARNASISKINLRREKILASIDAKITKLLDRLEKKKALAEKTREGTKTKEAYLADIIKTENEIEKAQKAREAVTGSLAQPAKAMNADGCPCPGKDIILSAYQENAYSEITGGFKDGKPVLLHGVTGAGKTEIYMKLAAETLAEGKNVLYLVPEIALSRQLEERLHSQFGDRLLTFHSGESAASRRDTAEAVRNASAEFGGYIVLCTRSGLFLPHHDLGLIIVDEEHDGSYKQDSPAPRYNGRDTALMLSQIHKGCRIILGSATPSLEEIYNTLTGRHLCVKLRERFHGSADAEIEIIDTRAERAKRGMTGNFSRKLTEHIRKTIDEGGQVLILRSRRAWATSLQCNACGEIRKCPHCNVSMSYHKSTSREVCHYCGHTEAYTGQCPKCGGMLTPMGSGTQKIEEEAAALFPQARIARLDSDSARSKSEESGIIRDFANGNTDILIGTQIITKGFDFGRLNLVAVIAADTLLGIQDFRADEKALQTLEQFRGRCGRRGERGRFVIQTAQPEHPIYRNILNNEAESTSMHLLMERKDFAFPPYTRIVELTVRDIFEDRAARMAAKLTDSLSCFSPAGPYSPVIDKVADRYIRKIRISFNKDRNLVSGKEKMRRIIAGFEKENRYEAHITIDVDPA